MQRRPYWDWGSSRLRQGEHFVPVASLEPAQLLPTLDWLDSHPAEAQAMAAAASGMANRTGFRAAVAHAAQLTLARIAATLSEIFL